MSKFGTETIIGKIVEVRNGEKRISRNYTYGYISLRVLVGFQYYSVLVAISKLNQYGFLPKVGQWIRVKGTLSNDKEGLYDASISKVTLFEHIEKPQ
ncbi:hypothetical protein LCGC14_1372790 [marine sediment metagenome]|uniref:OB domain-containing protein n=1 Tax=marine sediment metagenome TaxID=412755 RepID=A0A0F9K4W0_9ZZZZ